MGEVASAASSPRFPAVVFIHQASVEAGEEFFATRLPGARVISDPDAVLYDAFGLHRGGAMQLLGPLVWWRGLIALLKGNLAAKPPSDPRRMPGAFLVAGDRILWSHRARHAGQQPDLVAMLAALP